MRLPMREAGGAADWFSRAPGGGSGCSMAGIRMARGLLRFGLIWYWVAAFLEIS